MVKVGLEKAEEPEIKFPTYAGSSKKQEFQKNINFGIVNKAEIDVFLELSCFFDDPGICYLNYIEKMNEFKSCHKTEFLWFPIHPI